MAHARGVPSQAHLVARQAAIPSTPEAVGVGHNDNITP
jgi:hypothetical protein